MKPSHIAVDGPIGVGKTSLARRLATRFGAREILEDVRNPFLAEFYEGRAGSAFQCQAYFLLTRYRQQRELVQQDLFHRRTVTDYLFQKDKIFAYLNLDQDDLVVYERLWSVLVDQVARPDLVLYLHAPVDVLAERVERRGRRTERDVTTDYLGQVAEAYDYYFFHYSDTPLLAVDTRRVDPARSDEDLSRLLHEIEELDGGTRYWVPD